METHLGCLFVHPPEAFPVETRLNREKTEAIPQLVLTPDQEQL